MFPLAIALTLLVAVLHVGFLVLEMFLWNKPIGRRVFGLPPEIMAGAAPLAANQGLYNGFLAAWLRGARLDARPKHPAAAFERLNTWYYSDAPQQLRPQLEIARRTSSFDEVQGGLTEANALFEARRCLSCGNCSECDDRYGVCPDNAVIKLGPGKRFEINYDYCKGCAMCAAECPCGAIEMVAEEG